MSNLPYRPNPKPTQRQWERQQRQSQNTAMVCFFWGSLIVIALITTAVKWIYHALAHVSLHVTPHALAYYVLPELLAGALIPVVVILLIANSPRIRDLEYEEAFANLYPQGNLPDLRISGEWVSRR